MAAICANKDVYISAFSELRHSNFRRRLAAPVRNYACATVKLAVVTTATGNRINVGTERYIASVYRFLVRLDSLRLSWC